MKVANCDVIASSGFFSPSGGGIFVGQPRPASPQAACVKLRRAHPKLSAGSVKRITSTPRGNLQAAELPAKHDRRRPLEDAFTSPSSRAQSARLRALGRTGRRGPGKLRADRAVEILVDAFLEHDSEVFPYLRVGLG